ncbi:MAG: glutamine amidotransferase [Pseudomonadota bacterium]
MERYVLIEHDRSPGDDTASQLLSARGAELIWKRPFEGDSLEPLEELRPDGVIVHGGFQCADETERFPYIAAEGRYVRDCIEAGVPLLGICLGAQMIAYQLGARVGPPAEECHEFGFYEIMPTEAGRGFLPQPLVVPQIHFHTFDLPDGAELLASSPAYANQAFRYGDRVYGFQFHPEETLTTFVRRQNAPHAAFGKPGAQTRAEQDRLGTLHHAHWSAWFTGFLNGFFPAKAAPVAA